MTHKKKMTKVAYHFTVSIWKQLSIWSCASIYDIKYQRGNYMWNRQQPQLDFVQAFQESFSTGCFFLLREVQHRKTFLILCDLRQVTLASLGICKMRAQKKWPPRTLVVLKSYDWRLSNIQEGRSYDKVSAEDESIEYSITF